ncbi:MAG: prepilin-type N-terminal cleavage/methylation domain-containing protein [Verrucomicrobiota bacterium]
MKNKRTSCGFTLIELLLAIAVLSMVLVLVTQAVTAVMRTWEYGAARIDNFSKARVVLGLLDRDLQSAVLRPDLAAFVDESGSNACAFYTQISGSQGDRRLSLVRYILTTSSSTALLQRSDYGLFYSSGSSTLSLSNTSNLPDLSKTVSQDITDGILRFEWQFVAADGSLQSSYQYDSSNPSSLTNTRAIIISFITLDDRAFRLAVQSGALPNLLAKFDGLPASGQVYGNFWDVALHSSNFAQGLPAPVSSGVRIFERRYTLH